MVKNKLAERHSTICQSEGLTERVNEPPGGRCLQGVVDVRWVVVECYCFLINIIVDPPQPWNPHLYSVIEMLFTFSSVSLQSALDRAGRDLCCCRFRRDARPDLTFAKKRFVMKCSFVETPGPIYHPRIPLGLPWVSLGLPWVPLGPPRFS